MAFDFPDSPAVDEEYTSGGVSYFWTGTTWDLATVGTVADKVDKAGDTMTGPLEMTGAAAIHWDTSGVVTGQHDLSKGIALYGYGTTSQFGWNITSGTLNHIVQSASNKHNFIVGTENKLQIAAVGITQPTVANDKNGYFVGDRYHGMYFFSNKLIFTEYHDNFEWRRQTSGSAGGAGDLRMSLVGGALKLHGNNHFLVNNDNYGIGFYGGGFLYKKAGEGLILRESSGNYRSAIQNNAGTWLGWISYQASATLSVEELIEERVVPLLAELKALRDEIELLKKRR